MRLILENLRRLLVPLPLLLISSCSPADSTSGVLLDTITLPARSAVTVAAGNVPHARSWALSDHRTLFVGARTGGKVYAINDRKHDSPAAEVITLADGLSSPNGVAFRDGALYVAAVNRV